MIPQPFSVGKWGCRYFVPCPISPALRSRGIPTVGLRFWPWSIGIWWWVKLSEDIWANNGLDDASTRDFCRTCANALRCDALQGHKCIPDGRFSRAMHRANYSTDVSCNWTEICTGDANNSNRGTRNCGTWWTNIHPLSRGVCSLPLSPA